MRRTYGILIGAVLALTLGVAAGAGVLLVYSPLPDPSVATREQLVYWLILRDLSQESGNTRQILIRRLDSEFTEPPEWSIVSEQLDDSQRTLLYRNILLLLDPWFLDQVRRYTELPPGEKPRFLDRFLQRLDQWRGVGAAFVTSCSGDRKAAAEPGDFFLQRVRECRQRATSDQRRQIDAFLAAMQARWFWQHVPKLPGLGR